MLGFIIAVGTYMTTGQIIPGVFWMLVLAASMIGAFLLWSVLFAEEIDDDDDHGGGMMIPATVPTN